MNNTFYDSNQPDTLQDEKDLFLSLVQKALSGKHSNFEFIKSWIERCNVKNYIKEMNKIVAMFKNLFKSTYKTYLEQIKTNTQDLGLILAIKQFGQCIAYYIEETFIALDMLDEYKFYVFSGHLLDTLLGKERSEEDLIDFRTLPTKWF